MRFQTMLRKTLDNLPQEARKKPVQSIAVIILDENGAVDVAMSDMSETTFLELCQHCIGHKEFAA